MRCRRSELFAALAIVLLAVQADAGVRRFDLTTDASSNAEGEIELEGWLDFGRPQFAGGTATNGMAWLGARFGLLDNLELAGFLVFEKTDVAEPTGEKSGLMMWVTELRWRPVEEGKWPVDFFIQAQMLHWFEAQHPLQFRFTVGVSKNVGRFLLAANFSFWESLEFNGVNGPGTRWEWTDLSVGVSANLMEADGPRPSMNLGLEAWSLNKLTNVAVHSHLLQGGGVVVGPTLSLARGRLWLTAHLGLPVYVFTAPNAARAGFDSTVVGRIMLGLAL